VAVVRFVDERVCSLAHFRLYQHLFRFLSSRAVFAMWRAPVSIILSLSLVLGAVLAAEIVYVTELEIYSSLV
jgi:hypothetical protein